MQGWDQAPGMRLSAKPAHGLCGRRDRGLLPGANGYCRAGPCPVGSSGTTKFAARPGSLLARRRYLIGSLAQNFALTWIP